MMSIIRKGNGKSWKVHLDASGRSEGIEETTGVDLRNPDSSQRENMIGTKHWASRGDPDSGHYDSRLLALCGVWQMRTYIPGPKQKDRRGID